MRKADTVVGQGRAGCVPIRDELSTLRVGSPGRGFVAGKPGGYLNDMCGDE